MTHALTAVLVLPLVMGFAPAAKAAPTASPTAARTASLARASPVSEHRILVLVNRARANHGLKPLRVTTCPETHAVKWSAHMATILEMIHSSLDPLMNCPNARAAGQNIAYGYPTARAVFTAWMHSPEHRANILRPQFHRIGISGVVSATGVTYWTQDFVG